MLLGNKANPGRQVAPRRERFLIKHARQWTTTSERQAKNPVSLKMQISAWHVDPVGVMCREITAVAVENNANAGLADLNAR